MKQRDIRQIVIGVFFFIMNICAVYGMDLRTEKNLALGLTYESSMSPLDKYGDTGKKLIDQSKGGANNSDLAWVGFYRHLYEKMDFEVKFDLGKAKSVSEIRLGVLNQPSLGIKVPEQVEILVSKDNVNWVSVSNESYNSGAYSEDERVALTYTLKDHQIVARYIKINISIGEWWTLIDEVEIMGGENRDGVVENVAKGSYYEFNKMKPHEDYKDPSVELTDGMYGQIDINDTAWQGYSHQGIARRSIVIDLEGNQSIKKIQANFLQSNQEDKMQVNLPERVIFQTSVDGQMWSTLKDLKIEGEEGGLNTQSYSWDSVLDGLGDSVVGEMVYTRYVRIQFDINQYAFLDEIQVIGYEGKVDGAVEVPGDFEGKSNFAKESTYEYSVAPSSAYADSGDELIDGMYGGKDFKNPAWVGHNLYNPKVSIVFDLGERKVLSDITINLLYDKEVGIRMPGDIKILVSEDGENWSTLYSQSVVNNPREEKVVSQKIDWSIEEDGVIGDQIEADGVYGRYVKVNYLTDVWVFVDEVEIWGVSEPTGEVISVQPDKEGVQEYLKVGADTAYINNLVLAYNSYYEDGGGDWKKEHFKPYITYIDKEGTAVDTFFDGVLFLALNSDTGRIFDNAYGESVPSNKQDWEWYLNKTIKQDVAQLNEAVEEARLELGDKSLKEKVVLMIPYPDPKQNNFGDVDGDGVSENFNSLEVGEKQAKENQEKVIRWYIEELCKIWEEMKYEYVSLSALYWLNENTSEEDMIRYTGDLVHQKSLKYFWIPYYGAPRFYDWRELGFDAAAFQPNHYFQSTDASRIKEAAELSKEFNMGVEFEMGPDMFRDESLNLYNRYKDYLEGAHLYGYGEEDVFKAYYQHVHGFYQAAYHEDPKFREVYDWTYLMTKGEYPSRPNQITLDGVECVESNQSFEVIVGMKNVTEPIYSADLKLKYDKGEVSLDKQQGIQETLIVGKDELYEQGCRMLIATEGGLVDEEAIRLTFKAPRVDEERVVSIGVEEVLFGVINQDTKEAKVVQGVPKNKKIIIYPTSLGGGDEDITGDGKVDVADLALIAYYYQSLEGDEQWEEAKRADVNKDGEINIADLTSVANKILFNK